MILQFAADSPISISGGSAAILGLIALILIFAGSSGGRDR